MKIRFPLLLLLFPFIFFTTKAQTNITCTNPDAEVVMLGQYDPAVYYSATAVNHPDSIIDHVVSKISADSIHQWLTALTKFHNRSSGSDTVSNTRGIGAAQRWIYSKFQQWSAQNDNRLLPSYIQFTRVFCTQTRHKNVIAVLPGADTADKRIIIIEAHLDTRCEVDCDTSCAAYGADDNGSGSALVMELARVLSTFQLTHTVVFMLTTGEEQGLYGAEAFVDYVNLKDIGIMAVFNNDIVGGVYCGNTASFPGCSPTGAADTINMRLFSFGGFNSPHKQLARYIKYQYNTRVASSFPGFPTIANIMAPEDRTGRGGDHIPFREQGYTAVRFTSAFEHGDGNPSQAGYTDRQHTSSDSLGIDLDQNGSLDSFYIDFNYLRRNAVINAAALSMVAISPSACDFVLSPFGNDGAIVSIVPGSISGYHIAIRSVNNDWDSVYYFVGNTDTITGLTPGSTYIFSVSFINYAGVPSLFSREEALVIGTNSNDPARTGAQIQLLQNVPNPFDEETNLSVFVSGMPGFSTASLTVSSSDGRLIRALPLDLHSGMNEVRFEYGSLPQGVYFYSLWVDDEKVETRRMVVGR